MIATRSRGSQHGRPQKIFPGEQHRHFAYLFQIADDAMQMDVNKSLYAFYTTKIMTHVHGRWKGGWE